MPVEDHSGFSGSSDGKESCLQCGRPGFDSWVRKIPCRREWVPTPWGHKELDMTERLTLLGGTKSLGGIRVDCFGLREDQGEFQAGPEQ